MIYHFVSLLLFYKKLFILKVLNNLTVKNIQKKFVKLSIFLLKTNYYGIIETKSILLSSNI